MSTTTVEPGSAGPKTNRIGLATLDYRGGKTTLCAGCGHNAISERIIDAMYEMGVEPEFVIKPSGIGCSSKTPAYFLTRSHSFNAVHGRMPSVATGAMLANRKLICIGVSGDGVQAGELDRIEDVFVARGRAELGVLEHHRHVVEHR